ncbi:Ubiquitin carboxyl-terminal hydrolase 29 [Bulinus truncatus]|nr:Ubiquitin carboxyl-terminal hydrolase 29 [Bulinus truncatus]
MAIHCNVSVGQLPCFLIVLDILILISLMPIFPTEEKENDPADQARGKRLENIEVGKADFSYRLVGIVNHIGESLYAGHYTAFAYNLSKQKWFFMDDKHTKETSEAIAKRESLQSGYVFFYMDKDLFHEYAAKVEDSTRK